MASNQGYVTIFGDTILATDASQTGSVVISGLSGTTDRIPKFTSGSTLGDSIVEDDGIGITINSTGPTAFVETGAGQNLNLSTGSSADGLTIDTSGNGWLDGKANLGDVTSAVSSYPVLVKGPTTTLGANTYNEIQSRTIADLRTDLGVPSGSGTANKIVKFTSSSAVGDSIMAEVGSGVGIEITAGTGTEAYLQAGAGQTLVLLDGNATGIIIDTNDVYIEEKINAGVLTAASTSYPVLVKGPSTSYGLGSFNEIQSRSIADLRDDLDVVDTLVAGTGISVSGSTGAVTIGNTGVTHATAGTGIGVSASTGNVTFSNTGVTHATAGTGIGVSASTGNVTFSNTGVTQATAGTGIGVSAGTGNVTFSNTGVTQITAGTNVSISPVGGTGNVTINASGFVGGSGTTNKIPKWTASTTLGDSTITDTGSLVTIQNNATIENSTAYGYVAYVHNTNAEGYGMLVRVDHDTDLDKPVFRCDDNSSGNMLFQVTSSRDGGYTTRNNATFQTKGWTYLNNRSETTHQNFSDDRATLVYGASDTVQAFYVGAWTDTTREFTQLGTYSWNSGNFITLIHPQFRNLSVCGSGNASSGDAFTELKFVFYAIATASSNNSVTLSGGPAFDNQIRGYVAYVNTGPGAGQYRMITAWNGATLTATVSPDWTTNPTIASEIEIYDACGLSANSTTLTHRVVRDGVVFLDDPSPSNVSGVGYYYFWTTGVYQNQTPVTVATYVDKIASIHVRQTFGSFPSNVILTYIDLGDPHYTAAGSKVHIHGYNLSAQSAGGIRLAAGGTSTLVYLNQTYLTYDTNFATEGNSITATCVHYDNNAEYYWFIQFYAA